MIEDESGIQIEVVWVARHALTMYADRRILFQCDPSVDQVSAADLGSLGVQANRHLGLALDVAES